MTDGEEVGLVGAAQRGSADAFARLVERRQGEVRGFLRRLTGSHADADDLAQETFISAWTRLGSFRRGESLRAWLCGIAYRKWLTWRRGEGRRALREGVAASLEDQAVVSGSDARLDASRALQALSEDQRAAVALCLAAGFSHSEAAEALGMPLGTVKSHVARGREKLLDLLGAQDE